MMLKSNSFLLITLLATLISCTGGGGGGGGGGAGGSGGSNSNSNNNSQTYNDTPDPLEEYLWFMKNTGQQLFTGYTATTGEDINMGSIHDTIRGKGVKVVVSDSRIDLDHPDVQDNTVLSGSRNYATQSYPYTGNPTSSNDNNHGTAILGIIGAKKGNGIGLYGVAPEADLYGFNFIESDLASSKLVHQANYSTADVFNYSFGGSTCNFIPADADYIKQVAYSVYNRDQVFVTSAGNDFKENASACGGSGDYYGNGNLDQWKSYPYFIVVAAAGAHGIASDFSTPSSNVWVTAPGGDRNHLPMISTDIVGCTQGYSKSSSTVSFDNNSLGINDNCNYSTDGMIGTSFAAPVVTGVVALLKEANSDLTWREIKYILAKTAEKVNPTLSDFGHPGGFNLSGHTYEYGWITNTAGFNFHNWYGFGRVDVEAAVALAKNKNFNLYDLKDTRDKNGDTIYTSGTVNASVPDNSSTGASDTINVNQHNFVIEHVQVKVNVNATYSSDVGLELIAPSGTKSKLMNINSNMVGGNITNATFGSNAFYGERSGGNWTLKVVDGYSGGNVTLVDWSIEIIGNKGSGLADVTAPSPVTAISNSLNTITWTGSPSGDVVRYEVCVRRDYGGTYTTCDDGMWINVGTATSFEIEQFFYNPFDNTYSMNFFIGDDLIVLVRAIDSSENESAVATHSWTGKDGYGEWQSIASSGESSRYGHTAVWTGSEMIVWGGTAGSITNTGKIYDPATDTWDDTTTTGAPSARSDHQAIYVNGKMLVCGGFNSSFTRQKDCYSYDVAGDSWTSLGNYTTGSFGTTGLKLASVGTEVLIYDDEYTPTVGRIYDSVANSLSAATLTGHPDNYVNESIVSDGTNAIVWGGSASNYNDGAKYNFSTDSWSTISSSGAPSGRSDHSATWTGTYMVIWGGGFWNGSSTIALNTGGRYNSSTNTWSSVTATNAPSGREEHLSAWTGSEVLIWGGKNSGSFQKNGYLYDPSLDSWKRMISPPTSNSSGSLFLDGYDRGVWTGSAYILYGGNWGAIKYIPE